MVLYSDSDSYNTPDELIKLEIPIFPWTNCSKIAAENSVINLTNQICAGILEGGKDACYVRYNYIITNNNINL